MKLAYEKPVIRYWSVKTLNNIEARMSGGVGSTIIITTVTKFINTLKNNYGFNSTNAGYIADLYNKLFETYSASEASIKLFRIIASTTYGTSTSLYDEAEWLLVGGFTAEDGVTELRPLGYSEDFINKLYGYNGYTSYIISQHLNPGNNPDFAHMAATIATILTTGLDWFLDLAVAVFNGIASVDDNGGYIGDVCGTNFASPSMNGADYKADLDAVNIAVILQNSLASPLALLNIYYSDLNIISRADTFISNVTWEKINQQYDIYCGYWLYRYFGDNIAYVSEEDREAMLRPHLEVFDTFIRNLESHNNDYDSTL